MLWLFENLIHTYHVRRSGIHFLRRSTHLLTQFIWTTISKCHVIPTYTRNLWLITQSLIWVNFMWFRPKWCLNELFLWIPSIRLHYLSKGYMIICLAITLVIFEVFHSILWLEEALMKYSFFILKLQDLWLTNLILLVEVISGNEIIVCPLYEVLIMSGIEYCWWCWHNSTPWVCTMVSVDRCLAWKTPIVLLFLSRCIFCENYALLIVSCKSVPLSLL